MSDTRYEIREVSVTARAVAGVRAEVRRGHVGAEFGRYLDQVYAAGRAGVVKLDGQNIFIYRGASADTLTVDFCVGVTAPFEPTGNVVPLETPSGAAVMTIHHGDYSRLAEANAALRAWCEANHRKASGPSWEVYGHWDRDPAKLQTEVYNLLR